MVGSDAGPFKHEKDMSLAMMIARMPFNEWFIEDFLWPMQIGQKVQIWLQIDQK